MGSRREVVVLGAVLFALAAIALAVRPSGDAGGDEGRVSSFLAGPYGAAALYTLMDELKIPVQRQLRPWSADSSRDVLVVLAPEEPPTLSELRALRTWIENGGTLIYGSGAWPGVEATLGLRPRSLRPDTLGALATVRWRGATALPMPHPWTADIDSIGGFTRAYRLASQALSEPSTEVLLRTRDGDPTVVMFAVGAGRVIAWSDAAVLANRALRNGDAPLLFTRAAAAALADGGELRFDEYHHGYREASPARALRAVLTETGPGRALLQGAVASLALLLLAGARFGAPVREHQGRRRSPLEHVQALAGAYQRVDARASARRLLLAGMERRLGRRVLREADTLPPATLDTTPAGRRLKQEWERGTDADLAALSAAVDDFVMEVRRWK